MWSVKGASGTVPCMCCKNVVALSSDLHLHDRSGTLVPISETDFTKFEPATDRSIREAAGLLKERKDNCGRVAFDCLQQSLGLTYCEHGLLFDETCAGWIAGGPVTVTCFDWMHTYVVNGVFNSEVGYLMQALVEAGVTNKAVHDGLQRFTWPKRARSTCVTGQNVFENVSGTTRTSSALLRKHLPCTPCYEFC